jgi:glutamate-1-semialdehyde 2,1-aminomutase
MPIRKKSNVLYQRALALIPGGVNSPVRAFGAVGGHPLFIARGKGSMIYDVDGNAYIDYVLSWGPLILGHARREVVSAIKQAAERGTSFGAPTRAEVILAGMITAAFPSMEQIRLVNSGTEATMSAIRLARGFTKKNKIIKFEGCYHGHSDSLLVKAGSGAATFGIPTSAGVPADFAGNTIVVPYNDSGALRAVITAEHKNIAAVIMEPVCGNMGVVLPQAGFLADVRQITKQYGILLIFDEVMTGFRLCFGGAQTLYGIVPDITCLGKVIGGGMPIGAYGARREIMRFVSPLGEVYQAGTLSGNPIAVACGLKTLQILKQLDYNTIEVCCGSLCEAVRELSARARRPLTINRLGSMFTFFFTGTAVTDYQTAQSADTRRYAAYFTAMLRNGIYSAPSQFEANFLSFAHTDKDIRTTVRAGKKAFGV